MDNGAEVVAKLPNRNAGPAFFTIASQVATQKFVSIPVHTIRWNLTLLNQVREVLNLPCPRVYAYSADANNAVEAEYMIEEKAAGTSLSSVWYTWSEEAQIRFVSQLVKLETKLTSISFRCHGCLYHKKDLAQHGVSVRDLQAPLLHPSSQKCDHPLLRDYTIGPVTTAALWADERATMGDLNRGPCKKPSKFFYLLLT